MNLLKNEVSKGTVQIKVRNTDPLIVGQKVFLSSNDYTLNEADLEKAHTELGETESKKRFCLQDLKEKLSGEPITYRTDDDYLLRYLRFRKYDCHKAFKSIKQLYSKRKSNPDIFSLPSNLETFINIAFSSYLPYLDEDGCMILQLKFEKWDTDEASLKDLLIAEMAICDIASVNPHCQISGIRCIWNVEGLTLVKAYELLKLAMLISSALQDCYPWRLKQIVVINGHPWQLWMYKQARLFIKKKNYEKIQILGTDYHSELHKLFNPAILPKEYGGDLEEIESNMTEHIMTNLPYLKHERLF